MAMADPLKLIAPTLFRRRYFFLNFPERWRQGSQDIWRQHGLTFFINHRRLKRVQTRGSNIPIELLSPWNWLYRPKIIIVRREVKHRSPFLHDLRREPGEVIVAHQHEARAVRPVVRRAECIKREAYRAGWLHDLIDPLIDREVGL